MLKVVQQRGFVAMGERDARGVLGHAIANVERVGVAVLMIAS
ncbi:hypothetical protein [Kibdelosporangium aridum]|nr:hypothetical protein [Kibdelosporangium aridum]